MALTTTNKDLLNAVGAIQTIGSLLVPLDSVRPLAKVMRKLQTELDDINKARKTLQKKVDALVKEEAETPEDFAKRKAKMLEDEWDEFIEKPITIDLDKLSLDVLGLSQNKDDKTGNKIPAGHLMALDWLFDF